MKRIIFALVISVLSSACASAPRGAAQEAGNTACIQGGAANFIRHFTRGEAHVALRPQSNSQAGPYGRHCIPAGTNKILVAAASGPGLGASVWVIVSLQAGRQYEVRAKYGSGVYQFTIVDVSVDPEKMAYQFTVPYGSYGWTPFGGEIGEPIDLTDQLRQ